MPEVHADKVASFETLQALEMWLEKHHQTQDELWIKIYKKGSGVTSVVWDDVVVASLCFGWIDGIKKSLDDKAYLQRITPRKAKSVWSKRNREIAQTLIEQGRMREAGEVQINAAKEDGRWDAAYTASELCVPDDFIEALEASPDAKAFYESLNKTHKHAIAYALTSAKKAQTRANRFTKYLDMLKAHKKSI